MIKYQRLLILFPFLFAGGGDVKAVKVDEINTYKVKVNTQRIADNQMKVETASQVDGSDFTIFPEDQTGQTEEKKEDAAVSEASSAEMQARSQGVSSAEITTEAARNSLSTVSQSMKSMGSSTR